MSDRKLGSILDDAKETITQGRIDTHGQPEDSFAIIAGYYSVYLAQRLGVPVALTPLDAVNMAILFKQARKLGQKQHVDNYIDGAGYEAIGGWMVEQAEATDTVPVPQRVDAEVSMEDLREAVLGVDGNSPNSLFFDALKKV
jgi:hypothetical protein